MVSQWLMMGRYRLAVVRRWPDSPVKDATIKAIEGTLERLSRDVLRPTCPHCLRVPPGNGEVR
jgi:hypothetical protein